MTKPPLHIVLHMWEDIADLFLRLGSTTHFEEYSSLTCASSSWLQICEYISCYWQLSEKLPSSSMYVELQIRQNPGTENSQIKEKSSPLYYELCYAWSLGCIESHLEPRIWKIEFDGNLHWNPNTNFWLWMMKKCPLKHSREYFHSIITVKCSEAPLQQ